MTKGKRNPIPDSVHARLLNEARKRGEDYQVTFMQYMIERFLYRLSKSAHRDKFILKGAMLFRLWETLPYRTTMDLDLLHYGSADAQDLENEIREICTIEMDADGVNFDPDSLRIQPIRQDQEYQGQRVLLTGYLGKSKSQIQIDIGVGDAPWPKPVKGTYPSLLEFPAPKVSAYKPESVIAEKLEAMVSLGLINSRIKDFFDIHHLAMRKEFDGTVLGEAVRRTFERRKTQFPEKIPVALTVEFWEATGRVQHIRAFARRARMTADQQTAQGLSPLLRSFLWPILSAAAKRTNSPGKWPPGGPWG